MKEKSKNVLSKPSKGIPIFDCKRKSKRMGFWATSGSSFQARWSQKLFWTLNYIKNNMFSVFHSPLSHALSYSGAEATFKTAEWSKRTRRACQYCAQQLYIKLCSCAVYGASTTSNNNNNHISQRYGITAILKMKSHYSDCFCCGRKSSKLTVDVC